MTALLLFALLVLLLVPASLAIFTLMVATLVEAQVSPQGRFVDLACGRIHYVDKGRGPPIVILHGLGGQLGNFTYALLDRLAPHHRVVLMDRPGSGYSTRAPGASAGLRAQAEAVVELMRTLGVERPLLVGHSLGGAVALAVALDHPNSVAGLALIAPLTQPQAAPPAAFAGLAVRSSLGRRLIAWTLATPATILARQRIVAQVFAPDAAPLDFGLKGGGFLGLRPQSFVAASKDMVAVGADMPALAARYAGLDLPVGILFGRGDRILAPEKHGSGLQRLPCVALELTDGGHMLPVTAPETTAAWIRERVAFRGQETREDTLS